MRIEDKPDETAVRLTEQIESAYRRMAEHYRPMAPSDGLGHITVAPEELALDDEARRYATEWWREENGEPGEPGGRYDAGYPGFRDRPALIFLIEAARALNGGGYGAALRLAELAAAAIREEHDSYAWDDPRPLDG